VDVTEPEIVLFTPFTGLSFPEYDTLTLAWTASDNIALDSIRVYYSNAGDTSFSRMGAVSAIDTGYTFVIPIGVTDQAQVKLEAVDIYGNVGSDLSDYFSVTDNTPPAVTVTTPGNLHIDETTTLYWAASDNTGLATHHVYYASAVGETFTFIDSVLGSIDTLLWTVPNVLTENAQIRVLTYDIVGLTAADTSGLFNILDGIAPEITCTAPTVGYSIPEYHEITTTWVATDNIGLDSVHVYFSADGGTSFLLIGSTSGDSIQYSFEIPMGLTDSASIKL
ncbi:uncharacterized protein METZ01_LOCUS408970, partial [marine metagenome]